MEYSNGIVDPSLSVYVHLYIIYLVVYLFSLELGLLPVSRTKSLPVGEEHALVESVHKRSYI